VLERRKKSRLRVNMKQTSKEQKGLRTDETSHRMQTNTRGGKIHVKGRQAWPRWRLVAVVPSACREVATAPKPNPDNILRHDSCPGSIASGLTSEQR